MVHKKPNEKPRSAVNTTAPVYLQFFFNLIICRNRLYKTGNFSPLSGNHFKDIVKVIGLIVIVALLSAERCFAQSTDVPPQPAPDKWADWTMTLTPKTYEHYLDYPTSAVHSLVKVTAGYLQPPNTVPTAYEELYYTTDRAIGCKLKSSLDITPGTAGVIKIINPNPNPDQNENYGLANAVLRVYLDVSLNQCMTKFVMIPDRSFTGIKAALCEQGFHPPGAMGTPPSASAARGQISLKLVSDLNRSERLVMP